MAQNLAIKRKEKLSKKALFFLVSGIVLITLTLFARANNITVRRPTITRVNNTENYALVQFDLARDYSLKNTGTTQINITLANQMNNGSFETGDFTDWSVAGSAAHVEVLEADDFTVSGGTNDYDTSILSRTFTLTPGDVPATLSFDWSFMTSEGTRAADPYDDFFHVTLNSEVILAGSKSGGNSPYPDVATDGTHYQVTGAGSNGLTLNSDFLNGRSSFSNFSMVITDAGTYTLEFLVADQADGDIDSGLLVDNVQLQSAGLTNGSFETGDFTDWFVTGSAARVEVLQAANFTPNITPTEGNNFALLSTGPDGVNPIPQGNLDSFGRPEPTDGNNFALLSTGPGIVDLTNTPQGNIDSFGRPTPTDGNNFALLSTGPGIVDLTNTPQGNIDNDPVVTPDYDTSTLQQTFSLSASDVPATLHFDWSFLTAHAPNAADVFDDFFQVTLNGIVILSGSRPIGGVSPYPDVVTDAVSYQVTSTGTTNNSQFAYGRSSFSTFSMVITVPGAYTLEFLVADQADNNLDSGLLVDNVRIPDPEMDVQRPARTSIVDGAIDDTGNQNVGTVNVTYTIDNSAGTAQLNVADVTASNYTRCSNFDLKTATPINIAAGATATFDISFDVDAVGAFSFEMDIANNDGDENPYDIDVSGTGTGVDSDNDGIYDHVEGTADRDGDGIANNVDYDPSGWIYNEDNGDIISGGSISVSPSAGVNIIQNGSNGYYQFTIYQNGDYTLSYTPPAGFNLSSTCTAQTGSLDPNPATDPNPKVVGTDSRDGTSNKMTQDWSCGDNPYYWEFHLEVGDPIVINNNIPLHPQPTNIVLSSFTANVGQDAILINWTTETEPNNAGFNIFRNQNETGEYVKINENLIPALGNAITGANYSYTDNPENAGTYYYKLQAISLAGDSSFYGPVSATITSVDIKKYTVPDNYTLSQNYPNPFNPETRIEFGLPKAGFVEITIYDVNGKLVKTLVSGKKATGHHFVQWQAIDDHGNCLTSGVYFYQMRIVANGGVAFQETNKMILMK